MRISDVEVKALFEDRKFNVQSEHVNTKNNLTFKNRNYIVEKTAEYIKNSTLPDNATLGDGDCLLREDPRERV